MNQWMVWVAGIALGAVCAAAIAQQVSLNPCAVGHVPAFEDYSVKPEAPFKRASLKLNNEFSRMFRTRLREGLRDDPLELAGRYVVVTFGCGTGCLYGGFVDAKTGQATALPFALDSFTLFGLEDPLAYRSDSRLVVMRGTIGENERSPMERFYVWTGAWLKPICQRPLPDFSPREDQK